MSYSKIVSVNDGFKTSINIEFDLQKYEKIASYIPTEDVCEVLSYYYDSFKDSKINRSTILEGPYGKGKSHLLLSLLQLISTDKTNKETSSFLAKLEKIDASLSDKVGSAKNDGFKLLPVLINSNYAHLSQSLNIALKEALQREGLDDLFPNTAYEVAIGVIDKWTNEVEEKLLAKCLKKQNTTIEELKNGISNYSLDSFNKFVDAYNCIARGLEFNPFASDDIVKNYSDIAYKVKDYGYSGLFIVFDEFSKFIDNDNETLSKDLKLLQDLSEKASRTGNDGQIHLCCITHKSLNEYYKNKKETVANSFRTIEGRFQEIRFNRSLNQNYAIIALSLLKKKGFNEDFKRFEKSNKSFVSSIKSYRMFEDSDYDMYFKGCYPLNPLTVYSIIEISEKIAQNERTLFTFLSDSDKNSFSSFIKKGSGLFNVDRIYDYFEDVIANSTDFEIKTIGRKADLCLSKLRNEFDRRFIKTLAVIKMVGNEQFISNEQTIADCLNVNSDEVTKIVKSLSEHGMIKKMFLDDSFDFASANNKIIDEKVEDNLIKVKKLGLSTILNNSFKNEFVLPRKYNAIHKMTRYYGVKYILDEDLGKLDTYSLINNVGSDGLILKVLQSKMTIDEIAGKFKTTADNKTVILNVTKLNSKISNEIIRIGSLQIVKELKDLDDDTLNEISKILDSELNILSHLLRDQFSKAKYISTIKEDNFNVLVSEIMEREYSCTPVINNEMINKNSPLSTQYLKPRNLVTNLYISNQIERIKEYSPTSPEVTVFNSFDLEDTNKRKLLNIVKDYFLSSEKEKVSLDNLINKMGMAPYGVRKGVMPLFIGKAYQEANSNIVFYYETREIDFNAENISKAIENPSKYFIKFEKATSERKEYLDSLLKMFGVTTANNFRNDNKQVIKTMQTWILGLPRIIRNCTINDNCLKLDEEFINIKKIFSSFDLNEYETLFVRLPEICGSFSKTVKLISKYKNNSESLISKFEVSLSGKIKEQYKESKKTSLYNAVNDWVIKNKANERILEDKESAFVKIFSEKNYNDDYIVNEISKSILKLRITDWDKDRTNEIINFITEFNESIKDRELSSVLNETSNEIAKQKKTELTAIGNLVKNNIEDIFDEYNDSISNREKAEILSQILKELL